MAVLAVLAAALTLGGGAGAGTASQPPKKIDLSSPAAIDAYLRSIGVDPATVVKQDGLKNYAGPSCPGAGWTCTTSTRVVQVSHEGPGSEGEGENEAQCRPAADVVPNPYPDPNTCVIVQGGTKNHAKCKEQSSIEPLATQLCDITQTGVRNTAEIEQEITQTVGLTTQTGQQTAKVSQYEGEKNISQIHQKVNQRDGNGTSQSQDGFQRADVEQHAIGSENFSHVHQTQDQNESGSAATQFQNTATDSTFKCGDDKVPNPNQCADVFQEIGDPNVANPEGGRNASHLHQMIGERQTSTAAVSQTQGTLDSGQEGDVHQQNPANKGENLDFPDQDLRQRQSSPTALNPTQKQLTDPGCCGVGTQIGGAANREDIDQATTQSATGGTAFQSSSSQGQVHEMDTAPTDGPSIALLVPVTTADNRCSIEQRVRTNTAEGSGDFSAQGSGPECAILTLKTDCTSGTPPEEVGLLETEPGACVSTRYPPPPGIGSTVLALPLAATFGQDIAMPDYNAEPSDYSPPN
jgi:hypothetical protein